MTIKPQTKQEDSANVATAVDPVCGMTVNPTIAAGSYEYKGQTYYFSATNCLEKFRLDPERFLNKPHESMMSQPIGIGPKASRPEFTGAVHTCPMHPEVRQNKPDSCPKCGMALEPLTVSPPKQKVEYTCPMHPQVVRDAPGNCPICGMALEPRTVTAGEERNEELIEMTRRFKIGLILTIPLLVLAMSDVIPGQPLQHAVSMSVLK